jgi:microcompartment protein CcmL/EutN
MANGDSLGFVETFGFVAAIEAADAMVKAARVQVKTVVNADAGLISVVCEGDLAACQAAVDAGKAAAGRVGKCLSSNLIPRPDSDTGVLVYDYADSLVEKPAAEKPAPDKPAARGRKPKTTKK